MKNNNWFKNLFIFSLDEKWRPTIAGIAERLETHPLLPVNQASMSSQGWVPAAPGSGAIYSLGDQHMLCLGQQQRLLPGAVVAQALRLAAEALAKQQGFAAGRKQLRDLKDRVVDELRPRAFVKETRVAGWLDLERGRLVVNTASPKVAENFASVLRNDLGELPAIPLQTVKPVNVEMTRWLATGSAPPHFELDNDCELMAKELSKSAVRYVRHGLEGAEIRSLIQGGKHATRTGLVWRDRLSLVLTDPLTVRRVRFEAIAENDAGNSPQDAEVDAFEANFTLMTGEFGSLLDDVVNALGGLQPV